MTLFSFSLIDAHVYFSLFEIKIIKDYTVTPWEMGFGWGESIYKHKHFLNWGALPHRPSI